MIELAPFLEKWGPWVALTVYLIYKLVPVFIERFMPQLLTARLDERKAQRGAEASDRAALIAVYERFITQNESMVKFIGSSTAAIRGMELALDENTRRLVELIQVTKRGSD